MKSYRITLPSKERCNELAIRFENQETRIRLWLMGVACGVSYVSGYRFNVMFFSNYAFEIETDSSTALNNVKDHLEQYGCTITEIPN